MRKTANWPWLQRLLASGISVELLLRLLRKVCVCSVYTVEDHSNRLRKWGKSHPSKINKRELFPAEVYERECGGRYCCLVLKGSYQGKVHNDRSFRARSNHYQFATSKGFEALGVRSSSSCSQDTTKDHLIPRVGLKFWHKVTHWLEVLTSSLPLIGIEQQLRDLLADHWDQRQ